MQKNTPQECFFQALNAVRNRPNSQNEGFPVFNSRKLARLAYDVCYFLSNKYGHIFHKFLEGTCCAEHFHHCHTSAAENFQSFFKTKKAYTKTPWILALVFHLERVFLKHWVCVVLPFGKYYFEQNALGPFQSSYRLLPRGILKHVYKSQWNIQIMNSS